MFSSAGTHESPDHRVFLDYAMPDSYCTSIQPILTDLCSKKAENLQLRLPSNRRKGDIVLRFLCDNSDFIFPQEIRSVRRRERFRGRLEGIYIYHAASLPNCANDVS